MSGNSWKSALLLIAMIIATVRPMMAGNGQADSHLFGRPGGTPSEEEREGSERDTEPEQDINVEGQKGRRTTSTCRRADAVSQLIGSTTFSSFGCSVRNPACTSTSEHAFRFGLGAPLRI